MIQTTMGLNRKPNFKTFIFNFFQDELVAVAEKAVLRVTDLLDWIANPKDVSWDRGLLVKFQQFSERSPRVRVEMSKNVMMKCQKDLKPNLT